MLRPGHCCSWRSKNGNLNYGDRLLQFVSCIIIYLRIVTRYSSALRPRLIYLSRRLVIYITCVYVRGLFMEYTLRQIVGLYIYIYYVLSEFFLSVLRGRLDCPRIIRGWHTKQLGELPSIRIDFRIGISA